MQARLKVRVECYSGYKGDQRPLRFYIGATPFEVESIDDQWYSPNDTCFRVKASDGNTYILRHSMHGPIEVWTLEAFRRG